MKEWLDWIKWLIQFIVIGLGIGGGLGLANYYLGKLNIKNTYISKNFERLFEFFVYFSELLIDIKSEVSNKISGQNMQRLGNINVIDNRGYGHTLYGLELIF